MPDVYLDFVIKSDCVIRPQNAHTERRGNRARNSKLGKLGQLLALNERTKSPHEKQSQKMAKHVVLS